MVIVEESDASLENLSKPGSRAIHRLDCPVAGEELQCEEGKQWQREQQIALMEPVVASQACQHDKASEDLQHEALHGGEWIIGQRWIGAGNAWKDDREEQR